MEGVPTTAHLVWIDSRQAFKANQAFIHVCLHRHIN